MYKVKKRFFKCKNLFLISFLAIAGIFSATAFVADNNVDNIPIIEEAEAATPSSYTNVYRFTVPNSFGSDVGDHIYLHAWGSSGGDTTWGNFITLSDYSYNENSERMYTYATNYTYTGFIIIRYYDNPDYCKTADINVGSNKAWSWDGTNGASASSWTATNQTYYLYDYRNLFGGAAKCYAWQSGGSLNNGDYPGVAMTAVQYSSGYLYSISLDPAFDKFKCGIGDSANTGDLWINQNRGNTYCFWETNPGWSSDMEWVKAHDWIYNTMHIRDISQETTTDTGACRGDSGYYQKAKTAYQNYSDEIKAKMAADECWEPAQTRFSAWARANGEGASFSGTTLTLSAIKSFTPFNNYTSDNNYNVSTVIAIVCSSVALLSITALSVLLVKKRKHKEY